MILWKEEERNEGRKKVPSADLKPLFSIINPVNSKTVLFRKEQVPSSPGQVCGSPGATAAGQQKAEQARFASDHGHGCPDTQSTLPSALGTTRHPRADLAKPQATS